VMASGRPGRELPALDQGHAETAEREIVRERPTGASAADDQDVCAG